MSAPAAASIFAVELLAELVRRGVQDVVVCPGSRSQAFALAAAAAEKAGAIRLHVRIDERSAGFFALGVARETGLPAPVIVTSGTSVANLLPAALEAHEARVPMLLITADRPAQMREIRTNQTTHQADILREASRFSLDIEPPEFGAGGDLARDAGRDPGRIAATSLARALGTAGGAPAGPVQLNVQVREPLSGTRGFDQMIAQGFTAAAAEGVAARERLAAQAQRSGVTVTDHGDGYTTTFGSSADETFGFAGDTLAVVVAGEGAGPEAEAFAHAAGVPLLAEVVSGARFGREAIMGYQTLIDTPEVGGLIEQAIVFGHPTLNRQIPALLGRDDVDVIVVDPHADTAHYDPHRSARVVRAARVGEDHDPRALRRWLGAWVLADRELQRERSTVHEPDLEAALANGYKERSAYARAEVATMREPITRDLLAETVWRSTWPHDRLMLAASSLVRALDKIAPARRIEVRSNRGVAGIDGTIATALGVAAASQGDADTARAAGTTRVLTGDLAFLYDAGSLLRSPGEAQPRIQVFVGNDGGGSIFDGLEVAGSAPEGTFDRVMFTPHEAQLEQLAAGYGWEYQRITTRGELEQLLTVPVTGPCIVEVPLAR
ncbi:2-succinyl-5-enolpyruvyl-6-hydroxy-3-cyclohexene-1-carboxylic-acid synthase [Leucobacter sp. HY1910]